MKIKVYSLASDTRNGTDCEVFGSEAELNAQLVSIMEKKLESNGRDEADEIRAHIAAGEIDEAWVVFEERILNPQDTYCQGEHEIEVELPQVDALIGAATYVECRLADACDFGVQDKSPFYPSWMKITEALKPFSPAPTVAA